MVAAVHSHGSYTIPGALLISSHQHLNQQPVGLSVDRTIEVKLVDEDSSAIAKTLSLACAAHLRVVDVLKTTLQDLLRDQVQIKHLPAGCSAHPASKSLLAAVRIATATHVDSTAPRASLEDGASLRPDHLS